MGAVIQLPGGDYHRLVARDAATRTLPRWQDIAEFLHAMRLADAAAQAVADPIPSDDAERLVEVAAARAARVVHLARVLWPDGPQAERTPEFEAWCAAVDDVVEQTAQMIAQTERLLADD